MYDGLCRAAPRTPSQAETVSRTGKPLRQLFINSVEEREVRVDRHGRTVSEIDILSEKFDSEFKRVVPIIATVLQQITQPGQVPMEAGLDNHFAAFNTPAVPTITLEAYATRIAQNGFMSPASMVTALIFLDRLAGHFPQLVYTPLNVYKLYFVACRIASKVVEIRTLNNKNFAPIGGVDLAQLNALEAAFLKDVRFDLFVSPQEFIAYCNEVLRIATGCGATYVDRLQLHSVDGRVTSMVVSNRQEAMSPAKLNGSGSNAKPRDHLN